MSPLDELDAALRAAMNTDPRVRYAVAYGSRTQRPGGARQDDEHSDLEYVLYPHEGEALDPREFTEGVTPVLLSVINPFGTPNVVTAKLHRVELHVQPADRLADLLGWPVWFPDPARMRVKDEDGVLARLLEQVSAQANWAPEPAQRTFDSVLNSLVAVRGFAGRGERLRAHEWHGVWVLGGLIRLARHAEEAPQPPAAARRAEFDLSPATLARLHACAGNVNNLDESWTLALRLAVELAETLELEARTELVRALQPG